MAALAFALSAGARSASLSPAPTWRNGVLLGPARQACDLVQGTFTYNAETQKLSFKLGDKRVEMTRGSKSAKIDGKSVTLPVAPQVLNGTTYVPLRKLFDGLGLDVKPYGTTSWIVCTDKLCIRLQVPEKPK